MRFSQFADFHVHTRYSPCARPEATPVAMIRAARQRGLAALGFADHFTPQPMPGCRFYDGQQLSIVHQLRQEIEDELVLNDLPVVVGVEVDYTVAGPQCIDAEALVVVDHVIGAASHFHLPTAPAPAEDSPRAKADLMLRMAREMLALPGITVWAHPFDCSRMSPLGPIMATMTGDELCDVIRLAVSREVAIEINGGAGLSSDYREATASFFQMAQTMGARFSITADAHHPDDFARLELAWDWAQQMSIAQTSLITVSELLGRQNRYRQEVVR